MALTTYLKGIISEIYSVLFLILKGYRLRFWRMRNHISEIDLILQKGRTLIAVEVKYRRTLDAGLYAVSAQQKQKIRRAFELFLADTPLRFDIARCDVCVVGKFGKIIHIQNAF